MDPWGSIKYPVHCSLLFITSPNLQRVSKKATSKTPALMCGSFGGSGWIRTTEAYAADLQSVPFGHSGTLPYIRRASSESRCPPSMELVNGVEPSTC